jgi:type VI secretion system secreted protein VgrG
VIAGVVPNALTPSPVTRGNHTKNVIQTGGRNRLELEDKAGQQRITLSTPHANSYLRMGSPNDEHQMIIHTDGATLLDAGNNLDVTVGVNKSEEVKGATNEVYVGKQDTTVHGARIELHSTQDTHVKGLFWARYGNHEVEVDGYRDEVISGALTQTVKGALTQTVNGALTQTVNGIYTQHLKGPVSIVKQDNHVGVIIGATSDTFIGGANKNFIGGLLTLSAGAFVSVTAGPSLAIANGLRLTATGGLALNLNMGLALTVAPTEVNNNNIALREAAAAYLTSAATEIKHAGTLMIL